MEFRALTADEIECRIGVVKEGEGVSLLLYKDARCDMNILDETVGPENWQRNHEVVNGNLFCNVGIRIEPSAENRFDWVWKQDVGTESNTEAEKGQASDSFKRACFCWGIGRELYTAPFIWIPGATKKDKFWVSKMEVKDHKIAELEICRKDKYDNKLDAVVYSYPRKSAAPKEAPKEAPKKDYHATQEQGKGKITPKQIEAISARYKGNMMARLLNANGLEKLEDMTIEKASDLIQKIKEADEAKKARAQKEEIA